MLGNRTEGEFCNVYFNSRKMRQRKMQTQTRRPQCGKNRRNSPRKREAIKRTKKPSRRTTGRQQPQHRRRRRAANRTRKNRSGFTTIRNPTFIPRGDFLVRFERASSTQIFRAMNQFLKVFVILILGQSTSLSVIKIHLFHNFSFLVWGGGVRGLNFPFNLSFWFVKSVKDDPFFLPCKLTLHLAKGIRILLKRLDFGLVWKFYSSNKSDDII